MRCTLWRHTSGTASATDIDLGSERYEKATKTKRVDYVEYSHLESEYTRHKSNSAEVRLLFRVCFSIDFCLSIILFFGLCFCYCSACSSTAAASSAFSSSASSSSTHNVKWLFWYALKKGASIAETSQVQILHLSFSFSIFLFIFVIIFCAINRHGNQGDLKDHLLDLFIVSTFPCHAINLVTAHKLVAATRRNSVDSRQRVNKL